MIDSRLLAVWVVTLGAFFAAPPRMRGGILAAGGLVYAWWAAPESLVVTLALIGVVYVLRAPRWAVPTLIILAAGLVIGKLRAPANPLPGLAPADAAGGSPLIPLGLSFLIFELMHVVIERRRGRGTTGPLSRFAGFALYAVCRAAGPIKRYAPFQRSLKRSRWSTVRAYEGGARVVVGLVKKVVVADFLGLVAAELPMAATPLQAWKAVVAYAWFLYLDFSAYSDVAIGLSRILGLEVPENFRAPYLSANIREFWTRWHMSLTSWLTDYVYLPVAKRLALSSRPGAPRAAAVAGYLVTFTVCGLWHGLAANFLCWGLYHGVLLSAYSLWGPSRWPARWHDAAATVPQPVRAAAAVLTTFLSVCLGWVLFALPLPQALVTLRRLLGWA
jgi:alginate O-acetyltransferase complex protein AlgI